MAVVGVNYASHVTACMECRTAMQSLVVNGAGATVIYPCGHPPRLVLIPNPALAAEQED